MKKLPKTLFSNDDFDNLIYTLSENDFVLISKSIKKLIEEKIPINKNFILYPSGEPTFEKVINLKSKLKNRAVKRIIAIGGGSVIDTAKILALKFDTEDDLEKILTNRAKIDKEEISLTAIPTTAGTGTEVTSITVIEDKEKEVKKGIVNDVLIPDEVYLEPSFILSLSKINYIQSAIDAIVHAIESYLSKKADVVSMNISLTALNLLLDNIDNGNKNLDSASLMMLGSYYAGYAFNYAGVGLVHAMAYPVGGTYKVPHGLINAFLLPFVLKFNFKKTGTKGETLKNRIEIENNSWYESIISIYKKYGIFNEIKKYGLQNMDIYNMANKAYSIKRLLKNNYREVSKVDELVNIYSQALNNIL